MQLKRVQIIICLISERKAKKKQILLYVGKS